MRWDLSVKPRVPSLAELTDGEQLRVSAAVPIRRLTRVPDFEKNDAALVCERGVGTSISMREVQAKQSRQGQVRAEASRELVT